MAAAPEISNVKQGDDSESIYSSWLMGIARRFAYDCVSTLPKSGQGRLFYDRDYHVHLGGAISPLL